MYKQVVLYQVLADNVQHCKDNGSYSRFQIQFKKKYIYSLPYSKLTS